MPKLPFKFHLHLHKNGKLFGWGVSPNADWKVLFTVFLILTVSVFALGVYMFIAIANGDIFLVEKPATTTERSLDSEKIKKTVLYYETRAKKLEEIKSSNNRIVDPSL
ncbi:MAG: hypothetical protein WAV25_01025 [Minisyncoccia bacterium]